MEQISELKKRIRSISRIKQMTRAMQLISAIKSRKSRELLNQSFPFMVACAETMAVLLKQSDLPNNPMMKNPRSKDDRRWNIGFYVFSGDQGMAGAYNISLLNEAENFIRQKVFEKTAEGKQVKTIARVIGLVGADRLKSEGITMLEADPFPIYPPTYQRAGTLSHRIQDLFLSHEVDEIYFIYTRLNKDLSNTIMKTRVLPADYNGLEDIYEDYTALQIDTGDVTRIEFEPDAEKVFDYLIDTYLNGMTYGVMTEAYASEQTARMTAMDSATRSADDMLSELQIKSNQARQATITNELSEIVGGAEVLKQKRKA